MVSNRAFYALRKIAAKKAPKRRNTAKEIADTIRSDAEAVDRHAHIGSITSPLLYTLLGAGGGAGLAALMGGDKGVVGAGAGIGGALGLGTGLISNVVGNTMASVRKATDPGDAALRRLAQVYGHKLGVSQPWKYYLVPGYGEYFSELAVPDYQ